MDVIAEFEAEASRHPKGSKARKLLAWAAIELPDRAARIAELEEAETTLLKEGESLREALCTIKSALEVVGNHARVAAFRMDPDTFARDFAPFINIMVANGVPPYAKTRRKKA